MYIKQFIFPLLILFASVTAFGPAPQSQAKFKTYILIELSELNQLIIQAQKETNQIETYFQIRNQFKKVEYLLAHFDHAFYLKNINGAPLPKLEKKVPDLVILQPNGLQVMDEIILSDNDSDKIEYRSQLKKLGNSLTILKNKIEQTELSTSMIVQSIQYDLIRIFTLGLTGFDTPGTLNGANDAVNSLIGMKQGLKNLDLPNDDQKILNQLFSTAISNCQLITDFDSFDRFHFYQNSWQPLYAAVIDLYNQEIINTHSQQTRNPLPVNHISKHLFSNDFLNKAAFVDFPLDLMSDEVIQLGQILFNDSLLSSSQNLACKSCHLPEKGFSDGLVTSESNIKGKQLKRNAPGLYNSVYAHSFFYDLRADELSQQLEHVVFNDQEFNTTIVKILDKLSKDEAYETHFSSSFPTFKANPINVYTFKTALSAYVASLSSLDAEFDRMIKDKTEKQTQEVIDGFNLFMGKAACGTCHFAPVFNGLVPPYFNESESEVLGVPSDTLYSSLDKDEGRYANRKMKEKAWFYKNSFKTVTVRDANRTAPYMHNGVFENLDQVLNFYNNGGGLGHGLEVTHQTLAGDSLNLNATELKALKTFIIALDVETY